MTPADRFARAVDLIESYRDVRGRRLGLRSLVVTLGSERFDHIADDRPVDLRSISKVALAAAVGVGIDRGEPLGGSPLALDTPVVDLFAAAPAIDALPRPTGWEQVTVRHLLNCTIGHDEGFLFRRDIAHRDPEVLLDYVFGRPLRYPPGRHFAYSNVGPFLMSVLVQELTGQRLSEWVAERVFEPLGIADSSWRRYGRYDAGGTGLRLPARDLHTLAETMRGGGRYRGRQVLTAGWHATMTGTSVATPDRFDATDPLPMSGYGYGIWACGDGRYFGAGTDGQYLIVDPHQDLAVTTTADRSDMPAIRRCLVPLLKLPSPRVPG